MTDSTLSQRPNPADLRATADELAPDGAPEDTFTELEQTAASQLHGAADWISKTQGLVVEAKHVLGNEDAGNDEVRDALIDLVAALESGR